MMRNTKVPLGRWTCLLFLSTQLIVACNSSSTAWTTACKKYGSPSRSDHTAETEQHRFLEVGAELGLREESDGINRLGVFGVDQQMAGGIATLDLNNDGWDDLLATYPNREPKLLINDCGRRFLDATNEWLPSDLGPMSTSLAVDFTGDDELDLFFGGLGDADDRLFVRTGSTFTDRTFESGLVPETFDGRPKSTFGATASDVDLDGDLDLLISRWWPGYGEHYPSQLFINDGSGSFRDITEDAGLSAIQEMGVFTATFANHDDDPFPELFIVADWGDSSYFDAIGPALFNNATDQARVGTDENGMGSIVADLDGDGRLDWFIGSIYSEPCLGQLFGCTGNRFYRGTAENSSFVDATDEMGVRNGYWSWGTVSADLNLDGSIDLFQVNGSGTLPLTEGLSDTPARYWIGSDRDSTMREAGVEVGLDKVRRGRGVTYLDYDKDGDLDLVINVHQYGLELYRNDLGMDHHWLAITPTEGLYDVPSVEATIVVTDSVDRVHRRDIRAGDVFSAQRPSRAYFGFGNNPSSVTIDVSWPDGATVHIAEQPVNQYIAVEKPDD